MKRLFFIFFCVIITAQAQNYTSVDSKVKRYPAYTSVQQLAEKINVDFHTNEDKVRAAFIWLTHNIRYDLNEYYKPTSKKISFSYSNEEEKQLKLQQIKDQVVQEMFDQKKSVCEGYAQSFKKICDLLNIESVVIKGYARNNANEIGFIPNNSNHAWNAVNINNQWRLIDATWAAGYTINNKWKKHFTEYFFYPNPEALVRTHFPNATEWQLTRTPISKRKYANQPIIGQGFISKNLNLIDPSNGSIPAKPTSFKIQNLAQNHVVSYAFKGKRYAHNVAVTRTKDIATFTIDLTGFSKSELYIFINSEIALAYKIK